jgi:hypothetical protein
VYQEPEDGNLLAGTVHFGAKAIISGLPGDYNEDGTVNAADYAVWRDGGSPDDTIAGYNLWKANFGNSGGGAGASAAALDAVAAPEPSTVALAVFVAMACGLVRLPNRIVA